MFSMPSLTIPESGLELRGSRESSSKVGNSCPTAFGLTLNDAVIEDMIKCVENGKQIQLSLGEHPSLLFGTKVQHLSAFEDPFHLELFQSSSPQDSSNSNKMENRKPNAVMRMLGIASKNFRGVSHVPKATTASSTPKSAPSSSSTAGGDPAVAALKNSLASENAKKAENTIKYIKNGAGLPAPGRRGATTNKSKFLSSNRALSSDTTRSMPVSPALSGVGSPALGPTSVPLSQQQAEEAKQIRKPLVHELALQPLTEKALREKVDAPKDSIKQTLMKIADLNESIGKWELRKLYYKELDVWTYNYEKSEDRQRAIDNAVKIYDKSRLNVSDPLWDKLLPKAERGTGKCLSKLQAQIAQGPVARAPKTSAGGSTPDEDEDTFGDKNVSKLKGGESMARSASQPPATKQKKVSDKEAQAKRLFSKNPPKIAAAKPATPKLPPPKKAKTAPKIATKPTTKQLSSQFVNSSDEEDDDDLNHVSSQPIAKPSSKRSRDDSEASDSSVPLSKKVKKDVNGATNRIPDLSHTSRPTIENHGSHRASDSSHSSRPSTTSSQFSSTSKAKGNSPQKSSPLASSPPTNASESGNSLVDGRSSSSASPAHHTSSSTKNSRSPIHKRHQKSSSVASSVSSSSSTASRTLKPSVLKIATRYKLFYPKYEELHRELERLLPRRNHAKEKDLNDMRERLSDMKSQIMAGIEYN